MAEYALLANDPRSLGGYEIISRLGDGASGVVFKAKNENGTYVAIKVLRSELADQPKVRDRLRREASALQKVKGGRTARVLSDVGQVCSRKWKFARGLAHYIYQWFS